ncbi:hypothetical protein ACFQGE_16980 [Halomicroarcula sp. GCM10025817]|uniref:hypothetical protein n=1 Tax=Haloarcula TaxID=2237 RepID=UPI0023E7E7C9|nr:hypothetical protein [Halomicroarcula sp. SYNS111]
MWIRDVSGRLEALLSIVFVPAVVAHEYTHHLTHTYLFGRETRIEFEVFDLSSTKTDRVVFVDDGTPHSRPAAGSTPSPPPAETATESLVATVLAPFAVALPLVVFVVLPGLLIDSGQGPIFAAVELFLIVQGFGFVFQTGPSESDMNRHFTLFGADRGYRDTIVYTAILLVEFGLLLGYLFVVVPMLGRVP